VGDLDTRYTDLLESSLSDEPVRAVLGPGGPADIVSVIVGLSDFLLLFVPDLHTVVEDENVDGTALSFIGSDGLLERLDRRDDDTLETFFVHRHLDRDVREPTRHPRRLFARIVR